MLPTIAINDTNVFRAIPFILWKMCQYTIMMFTLSAGINCFIILKLYFFGITHISFDKCEHFCK